MGQSRFFLVFLMKKLTKFCKISSSKIKRKKREKNALSWMRCTEEDY